MWRRRFLIDVWAEPRDDDELPVIIRARVRDVATGEEYYVGSHAEIEHIITTRLDADGVIPRRWERP
jgi:hypothetical protein